jgi:arabinogalactan oligomer / maltooligosaccharide transport system permease protein
MVTTAAAAPVPTGAAAASQSAAAARRRITRTAYLYILPAAVVMLVMTAFPLLYQLWLSLTNYSNLNLRTTNLLAQMLGAFVPSLRTAYNSPTFLGVDNYVLILTNELGQVLSQFDFWKILFFNLIWTFSNVVFHVAIGVAVAVLLNTPGLWFKPVYRAFYILPWAIPGLVASMVWKNLFDDQFGVINMLLGGLGLPHDIRWWQQIDPPIPFLPILPLSFYAALITNIWLGWPFMMTIATGALQSIPRELYEAASVDGASAWRKFWTITVPMLRPAMVPAIMIGMMWTFNQFNVIYFTSGGGPVHSTEILVTQAYRLVNETTVSLPGVGNARPYGIAAAFAYIVFAVLAILTLLTNRVSRATEAYYD